MRLALSVKGFSPVISLQSLNNFSCWRTRELSHRQNFSVHFLHGAIHHAVFVVENSQSNDLAAEPFEVFGGVGVRTDQITPQSRRASRHGGTPCHASVPLPLPEIYFGNRYSFGN
jgi:hypothetical protein